MNRSFTGRHMAALLVVFFGVVVTVNVAMARYASSTFGGIVVENSYVASQKFNHWLEQAAAQEALGWEASAQRDGAGKVVVALSGAPAGVAVAAVARHPLGRQPDAELSFASLGDGRFVSRKALPEGRWTLRLIVTEDAAEWRREVELP